MSKHNKKLGDLGEKIAIDFLAKKDYQIIAQNWRNSYQEIDLIGIDNKTLVFVEVKTRSSTQYGQPESAITANKQKQLFKAAEAFIETSEIDFSSLRFDVVSILMLENKAKEIAHFEDAFYPNWS